MHSMNLNFDIGHKMKRAFLSLLFTLALAFTANAQTLNNVVINSNVTVDMEKHITKFLGHDIDAELLQALLNTITNTYRNHGYLAAQAFFPEQTSTDGSIEVIVNTATVDTLYVENHDTLNTRMLDIVSQRLQDFSGKAIDTTELNSQLLRFKDLNAFDMSAQFKESSKYYDAYDFDLHVANRNKTIYNLFYDNYGNGASGKNRFMGAFRFNNFTRNADVLTLIAAHTNENQNTLQFDYSIPLNYHPTVVGMSFNYGNYELGKEFSKLGVKGNSLDGSIYIKEPIYRSPFFRATVKIAPYYRKLTDKYQSYDLKLSRNKKGLSTSFDLDYFHNRRFSIENNLEFNFGKVTSHDELKLYDNISYLTSILDSNLNYKFGDSGFSIRNHFNLQYSNKEVDPVDKFTVGGAYKVKAFEGNVACSDMGLFNEFKVNFHKYYHGSFDIYSNLDAAVAKNKKGGAESFMGIGTGIRYSFEGFFIDTSLNKAVGPNKEYAKDSMKFLISFGYSGSTSAK